MQDALTEMNLMTTIRRVTLALFSILCIGSLIAQQDQTKHVKLRIWVKAFIPNSHPISKDLVREHPKDKLRSVIKGPGWTGCFATDGRTFSSDPRASARVTAEFTVETDGKSAKVVAPLKVQCGPTYELDCDSGDVVGTTTTVPKVSALGAPACADGLMQIVLQAAAANPRVPASPWIDFSMDVLFDVANRRVTCKATVGKFPAFEAYAEIGGKTWEIFRVKPSGETPVSLFDLGTGVNSVPVNIDLVLEPAKAILCDDNSLADFVRVQGLQKFDETNEIARRRLFGVMSPGDEYKETKEQNELLLVWLRAKLDAAR
jgi:hypothetical protein